jgi:hypothetical protein
MAARRRYHVPHRMLVCGKSMYFQCAGQTLHKLTHLLVFFVSASEVLNLQSEKKYFDFAKRVDKKSLDAMSSFV